LLTCHIVVYKRISLTQIVAHSYSTTLVVSFTVHIW